MSHWWNILVTIYVPLWYHRWKLSRHRQNIYRETRALESLDDRSRKFKGNTEFDTSIKATIANRKILLEQAQSSVWEETMLPRHDSFNDYVYVVIQFAYVCCFSVVLPITPLIVLLNYLFSMRVDAYKLCRGRQRPLSQKSGGIGVWENVLNVVTVVAVLTNCALMAISSSQFIKLREKIGDVSMLFVVIGLEHVMLFIKYILHTSLTSMPKSVLDSMKKERYEINKKRNSSIRAKKERRSLGIMEQKEIQVCSSEFPSNKSKYKEEEGCQLKNTENDSEHVTVDLKIGSSCIQTGISLSSSPLRESMSADDTFLNSVSKEENMKIDSPFKKLYPEWGFLSPSISNPSNLPDCPNVDAPNDIRVDVNGSTHCTRSSDVSPPCAEEENEVIMERIRMRSLTDCAHDKPKQGMLSKQERVQIHYSSTF
uniref:Anoctamin transmembrane domain-containing protein n=1 Tax=Proboscia inermis TaxID=420281 RepID=A0A7S0G9H2_9STRA